MVPSQRREVCLKIILHLTPIYAEETITRRRDRMRRGAEIELISAILAPNMKLLALSEGGLVRSCVRSWESVGVAHQD